MAIIIYNQIDFGPSKPDDEALKPARLSLIKSLREYKNQNGGYIYNLKLLFCKADWGYTMSIKGDYYNEKKLNDTAAAQNIQP